MGSVQSLNPEADLLRFFELMYAGEEGYAYSPTKDPQSDAFNQEFFHWPTERQALVAHVLHSSTTHEVYYSPSLFKSASGEKEEFKGSNYVWCEFDGNAQGTLPDLPPPSIKVQSSLGGNQHWYWKLDHFETDIAVLEDINQRIAYSANADLACWNANRVLRPPGTTHHESGRTTLTLYDVPHPLTNAEFGVIPELTFVMANDEDITNVPQPLDVLMKYPWTGESAQLFRENAIPKGQRSGALTKLCHFCIEKEMNNAETLAILLNADSRWGKFAHRKDRNKQLVGIINYCRSRHPIAPVEKETSSELRVYTYSEFMATKIEVNWAIPGLVHQKGIVVLSGPPGVGKSMATMRFAEAMSTGKPFLKWEAPEKKKILFISMEMPHEEIKVFLDTMKMKEDENLDNFQIMPVGSSLKLTNKKVQEMLRKAMDEYGPDGVVFDSLGSAVSDDLSSDKIIFETLEFVDRVVRDEFGAFAWFLHHNRKAQATNKKPNKLEDMYGSQYIGARLTTGITLWPGSNGNIEVSCPKLRLAAPFKTFYVQRTNDLNFKMLGDAPSVDSATPIFDGLTESI